ncbi:MAG: 2-oxoacid:ferredoxin oxidoreductase subunit beta [Melioribacteraceae bacterium]|nr:2-oxoacid:ferredoxin oxidoreductase subunit beta [Melioribacteraceae bacterium]MCF8263621.1 2-oxoacid:ferredoxin oxidoreductase subunit beta [Melioribacteraceae bacterium]MCF8431342.1 2-oxoacid:ferredoxin oxidoreductase subunit beta [Melioribacteraceae bacterium]
MTNKIDANEVIYKAKDFASDQDVRWCPGCGDYSILAQVQRSFPDIGKKKEEIVWVSGIGCSSRFPYYMNTYGFHSIHGRAPAIATGLKVAHPELSVWVATGDGDLLSIGGNHFIHAIRRNVDINILLFNNQIYGLTKGQYSPTSEQGKVTRSTPFGSVDYPFNPASLAIGAEATFVARTIDREPKHMQEMIKRANSHKGISFVEIYQNCNIFNDGAFEAYTNKETKADTVLHLEHGKPMVFGKENEKGIRLDGMNPVVADLKSGEYSESDMWVHDEFDKMPYRAFILATMAENPDLPTPIGIFRQIERPTYDEGVQNQVDHIIEKKGRGNLEKLLFSGNTWEVN